MIKKEQIDKIDELQKQVDELKEECENMQAEIIDLESKKEDLYFQNQNLQSYIDNHEPIWKRNAEQAVKDTAKEILQGLENMSNNGVYQGKLTVPQMRIFFKEHYGVEVEE